VLPLEVLRGASVIFLGGPGVGCRFVGLWVAGKKRSFNQVMFLEFFSPQFGLFTVFFYCRRLAFPQAAIFDQGAPRVQVFFTASFFVCGHI